MRPRLSSHAGNPTNAGDGYSMAYHAGAELSGIECFQINPLIKDYNGPACVYETGPLGGYTTNSKGERFIECDYWSGQMMQEFYNDLQGGNGPVFLKLDHFAEETISTRLGGSLSLDAGGQLRDGIASVANVGVCPESDWPYDNVASNPSTHIFPPNAQAVKTPPPSILQEAGKYRSTSYEPLSHDVAVLESCIAGGYPFMFGFNVYGDFNESTTVLHKPGPDELTAHWGHALLAIGYNQSKRTFCIRNSWGPTANDRGNFDMDYDYILNSAWAANFGLFTRPSVFATEPTA